MSRAVSLAQHLYYKRYRNQAEAHEPKEQMIHKFPEVFWRIRPCRLMDDGRTDRYGNPHYHLVKEPFAKKNPPKSRKKANASADVTT